MRVRGPYWLGGDPGRGRQGGPSRETLGGPSPRLEGLGWGASGWAMAWAGGVWVRSRRGAGSRSVPLEGGGAPPFPGGGCCPLPPGSPESRWAASRFRLYWARSPSCRRVAWGERRGQEGGWVRCPGGSPGLGQQGLRLGTGCSHRGTPQPSTYHQQVLVSLQRLEPRPQPARRLPLGFLLQSRQLLAPGFVPGRLALGLTQGNHCGERAGEGAAGGAWGWASWGSGLRGAGGGISYRPSCAPFGPR